MCTKILENIFLQKAIVLSIGQRYADWFFIYKFCVSGKKNGTILSSNEQVLYTAGVEDSFPAKEPSKSGFKKL